MNKIPLVSWSGGIDSTANVIYLFSKQIPFETVYIKLPNNKIQQKRELKARKKILKFLTNLYGNYHVKDHIVEFVGPLNGRGGFAQPYIWATSISYVMDLSKYSELIFGYIRGDDFWHAKNEFELLINTSIKLLRPEDDIKIKFSYPLEWHYKDGMIRAFYYFNEKIKPVLELTDYCENPLKKPCGKCKKCLEARDAIAKIEKEEGAAEQIKQSFKSVNP